MVLMAHGESGSTGEHDRCADHQFDTVPSHPELHPVPPHGKAASTGGNQRQSKSRGTTPRRNTTTPGRTPEPPNDTRELGTSGGQFGMLSHASADAANARSQRVDHGGKDSDRVDINELVKSAQDGDRTALEELIKSVTEHVLHVCISMLKNPSSDYESAAQNVFTKIALKIDGFSRRSSFKTWVTRIAVNECRDIHREERRTEHHTFTSTGSTSDDVATRIEIKPDRSGDVNLAWRWVSQHAAHAARRFYESDSNRNQSLVGCQASVIDLWTRVLIVIDERKDPDWWNNLAQNLGCEVGTAKMRRDRFRKLCRDHLADKAVAAAERSILSQAFAERFGVACLSRKSIAFQQLSCSVRDFAARYDYLDDEIAAPSAGSGRVQSPDADRLLSTQGLTTATFAELLYIQNVRRVLTEEIAKGTGG